MILNINVFESTTLGSTTSCLMNGDIDIDDNSSLLTTASSTTTSTLSQPRHNINIIVANNYLDSLSNEQIVEMEAMLDKKEIEFENITVQIPEESKVYKKV